MLLPALNKARESANRVKCASQLRQIGQWVAMYAAAHKNFIPIGYSSLDSVTPGHSVIWYLQKSTFINGPVGLGYLFSSGIAKSDPQALSTRTVWYCPNIPSDWRFSLDKIPTNRWLHMPLSDNEAATWPFGGQHSLKMGYASRTALTSRVGDEQTLRWTNATTGTATAWACPVYFNTSSMTGARLRSASTWKNKAIVSDLIGDPRLIEGVHKNGVNVLYANYGVKWVPLEHFKDDSNLTRISAGGPTTNYINANGNTSIFAQARIWETFDRQ